MTLRRLLPPNRNFCVNTHFPEVPPQNKGEALYQANRGLTPLPQPHEPSSPIATRVPPCLSDDRKFISSLHYCRVPPFTVWYEFIPPISILRSPPICADWSMRSLLSYRIAFASEASPFTPETGDRASDQQGLPHSIRICLIFLDGHHSHSRSLPCPFPSAL